MRLIPVFLVLASCMSASAQTWDVSCPGGQNAQEVSTLSNGHKKAILCVDPDTGSLAATSAFSGGGSATLPSGVVFLILSGTCPAGSTEVTALNGKMLKGTLAANGDVGTTGGNATITPSGTISAQTFTGSQVTTSAVSAGTPAGTNSAPTFAGSALASHAHELPFQIPSTTTTRQIASATFGTGTSRAATAVSATGTSNTTSAAVALSQSVSAGTPAGTVSAPTFTGSALGTHTHTDTAAGTVSQATFTGNAIDPSPSFVKVIFCAAN